MKIKTLGKIIAQRKLIWKASGEKNKTVRVCIGLPRHFIGRSDYFCPYRFIGLSNNKIRYAVGTDSVQAILLAMQMIGFDVKYRGNDCGGLEWFHAHNAGFPTSFGRQSKKGQKKMKAMKNILDGWKKSTSKPNRASA